MRRILTGSAVASAALVLLLPASAGAGAGLGFTVQQGFASPTVELGSANAEQALQHRDPGDRYVPLPATTIVDPRTARRLRAARSPESARSSWAAPGWPA